MEKPYQSKSTNLWQKRVILWSQWWLLWFQKISRSNSISIFETKIDSGSELFTKHLFPCAQCPWIAGALPRKQSLGPIQQQTVQTLWPCGLQRQIYRRTPKSTCGANQSPQKFSYHLFWRKPERSLGTSQKLWKKSCRCLCQAGHVKTQALRRNRWRTHG